MIPAPGRLAVRRLVRRDVAEAFRWYEGKTPGLGHEFLRAVAVVFAAVDREPERFPVALDDVRKAVVARFPYVVYYVALPEGPTVIAVVHGRRHPRRWQSRR
ncbi:hypothetical protein tb265_32890 [Gemmatimonadetes bacterium T265]|nr:hypothetical protein tb265_32890 [Gemmatimonadetes bacterium T265]